MIRKLIVWCVVHCYDITVGDEVEFLLKKKENKLSEKVCMSTRL